MKSRQSPGEVVFHGTVRDDKKSHVEDAIVMAFACFDGGIEIPLDYTFTDKKGKYYISVPKLPGSHDILRYKVRASKPQPASKEIGDQNGFSSPEQDEIENEAYVSLPAEVIIMEPVKLQCSEEVTVYKLNETVPYNLVTNSSLWYLTCLLLVGSVYLQLTRPN